VTLPEALPIAVISRFIQWFHDFGIPVGGILVNMLIDQAAVGADAADFVKNRVAMQQEHMKTVWQKFDGSVRAVVPLFETEIRGLPMLRRLGEAVFA
jgi:arsenite-transporting ATPase